jgi:hypothetical protein
MLRLLPYASNPLFRDGDMGKRKFPLRWLVLAGIVFAPAGWEAVAQTTICFKKKCLVYPNGSSICEYTPVDCSKVSIE